MRDNPPVRIDLPRHAASGGVDHLPVPGRSGRMLLCGFSVVGPDPAGVLDELGASTLVCLIEPYEIDQRFPSFAVWLSEPDPHRALHVPVVDRSVPDDPTMVALTRSVGRLLTAGEGVVVHCGAGWGRAGTLAACVLVASGAGVEEALATVATERPGAGPESEDQHALVRRLAPVLAP